MCAAPAAAAALAVLFPIIFNHPFPFFPLTIVFLVIDIVTSARIASVCIEDVVVRINKKNKIYTYVTGRLRNPCVCKHPRVYANTRPNQGVCIHPRAFANALGCLQTPGSFRVFPYTLGCFKRPRLFANTLRNPVQRSHHLVLYRLIRGPEDRRESFGVSVCPFHESTELFK